jgi:phosphatidylglycerol:prolipoprotein diacylglycerol transferase
MYQYLELGQLSIPMYNLIIGIGIVFGVLALDRQLKSKSLKDTVELDLYIAVVISIVTGFLGAKFFHLLYTGQNISLSNVIYGGMTYYGGFVCGIIIFILYNLVRRKRILFMLNIAIPSLIIAHAFGRIGCFLGGCCFGRPTNTFIGVNFPNNSIPFNHYGHNIKIYPTQLFESIFLFMLFVIIKKLIKFEQNLIAYLVLYGLFRFFIEFFRGDDRGVLFTSLLSPSQIISILFVILGMLLYVILRKKEKVISGR